jgi:hypothetical protein
MIRDVYYGVLTQKYNLSDYLADQRPKSIPNPNANRIHNSPGPNGNTTITTTITNSQPSILTGLVEHTKHCFDYILQGIKCAGDMTAEPAARNGSLAIDGWGVAHQCKSFDAAAAFMMQHKAEL